MITNLKFAKYFITQNDSNSMFGYTLVNYETCINFMKNICRMKFNLKPNENNANNKSEFSFDFSQILY